MQVTSNGRAIAGIPHITMTLNRPTNRKLHLSVTVEVTRYVTPLREGGSLPAIVEADDFGTYVLKFRGAGQGTKVLIAELLAGEIGRKLGLPVPELVFAELDPAIGRYEPDPEIQELIERSDGLNLGMDYPARLVRLRCAAGRRNRRRAAVRHRLVRRLHDQRRSHAAQHEHAHLAP